MISTKHRQNHIHTVPPLLYILLPGWRTPKPDVSFGWDSRQTRADKPFPGHAHGWLLELNLT